MSGDYNTLSKTSKRFFLLYCINRAWLRDCQDKLMHSKNNYIIDDAMDWHARQFYTNVLFLLCFRGNNSVENSMKITDLLGSYLGYRAIFIPFYYYIKE